MIHPNSEAIHEAVQEHYRKEAEKFSSGCCGYQGALRLLRFEELFGE